MHADYIEAVIKIFSEAAVAHPGFEILMRGGDDAHVHPDRQVTADTVELTVGEHAQQARLQLRRHVADLVQEQRATVSLLETPLALTLGAGEGAAFVSEQLRLQQLSRNRRGVQRDKGRIHTRAVTVQGARPPVPFRYRTRR